MFLRRKRKKGPFVVNQYGVNQPGYSAGASSCSNCGRTINFLTLQCYNCGPRYAPAPIPASRRRSVYYPAGGSGYSVSVCGNCDLPLCQEECRTMTAAYMLLTRCQDCGSMTHQTYASACLYPGFAAPLPTMPGPGAIRSTGLHGYSEQGAPDDWDLAMGTVRGYRWWKIDIPESWAGVRSRDDEGPKKLEDNEVPRMVGANQQEWKPGKIEAKCVKNLGFSAIDRNHEPPEWRTSCGCGFWAYFDKDLRCDEVLYNWQRSTTQGKGWTGIAVFGTVRGSGRVIVGEKGFRSQYAEVESLAIGACSVRELMTWDVQAKEGGPKSYYMDGWGVSSNKVAASDEEVLSRMAMIEDLLGRAYPNARILSSEKALTCLYPPEPGYGKN